ncbi:hypothetical protein OUZ56_010603 [Daphnia magna]|uniref:Uncharacterized protein n=1 Tax=Daphnia magna TaxID=35525 RepID=A0ABR0AJ14_9CRUS|nr:hypothetical protein OUZ56_010603 [Daphnia magna]
MRASKSRVGLQLALAGVRRVTREAVASEVEPHQKSRRHPSPSNSRPPRIQAIRALIFIIDDKHTVHIAVLLRSVLFGTTFSGGGSVYEDGDITTTTKSSVALTAIIVAAPIPIIH